MMMSIARNSFRRTAAISKGLHLDVASSRQKLLLDQRRRLHSTAGRRNTPLAGSQSQRAQGLGNTSATKPNPQNNDDLQGLFPVLATFFGAFGLTIGYNYLYNNEAGVSRLLPDRYNSFRLVDAQQCNSLMIPEGADVRSLATDAPGLAEHVHLAVEPPSYIAPPKLKKEQVDELVGVGGSLSNVWRIVSIWMKEPALQIERPYTPLYASALMYPRGDGRPIDLLIKRYPDGELGRYAHRLDTTQTVELRGPEVTWQGTKKDELVMIVGGTGITPAFQLATSILGRPDDETNMLQAAIASPTIPRVSILYAASRPSSFLLVPELARLKKQYGDRVHVQLLADQKDADDVSSMLENSQSSWTDRLLRRRKSYTLQGLPLQVGAIDNDSVWRALESPRQQHKAIVGDASGLAPPSRQVLVCGPDGMVAHVAGPKQPQSQGPLSGVLQRLGVAQEEVWKL